MGGLEGVGGCVWAALARLRARLLVQVASQCCLRLACRRPATARPPADGGLPCCTLRLGCGCREGLHRLTQIIFSKAQPKRLGSQILSGPMLAGLTEAYVTAINNG